VCVPTLTNLESKWVTCRGLGSRDRTDILPLPRDCAPSDDFVCVCVCVCLCLAAETAQKPAQKFPRLSVALAGLGRDRGGQPSSPGYNLSSFFSSSLTFLLVPVAFQYPYMGTHANASRTGPSLFNGASITGWPFLLPLSAPPLPAAPANRWRHLMDGTPRPQRPDPCPGVTLHRPRAPAPPPQHRQHASISGSTSPPT